MVKIQIRQSEDLLTIKKLHKKTLPSDEFPSEYSNSWIAYDKKKPIGFCTISLVDKETLFLSRAGILSDYKGLGLHKRLINVRVRWAKKLGYKKLITYVHPHNIISLRNLLGSKFEVYIPQWEYVGKDFIYLIRKI